MTRPHRSVAWSAVAVAAAFLASACVGAIAVRGGLAAGTMRAAAGGGAARAAAAAGARSMAGATARVGVQAGAASSAFRGALADLTGGGTSRVLITIERGGAITSGGRHLATIEASGDIVSSEALTTQRTLVGRVSAGRIWEVSESGTATVPVGRVLAAPRGGAARLLQSPGGDGVPVALLRRGTHAELLRVSSDWYELRLLDGRSGWTWAPTVALGALLASTVAESGDSVRSPSQGADVMLRTGVLLRLFALQVDAEVVHGVLDTGEMIAVAHDLIQWVDSTDIGVAPEPDAGIVVRLASGAGLHALSCELRGGAAVIRTVGEQSEVHADGRDRVTVVDAALVREGCAAP